MGVKDLGKLLELDCKINLKELEGKTIAIDVHNYLYRILLGSKAVNNLTNEFGKITTHINIIIANILRFKQYHIKTIWVFDNKEIPVLKEFTCQKRQIAKDKAKRSLESPDSWERVSLPESIESPVEFDTSTMTKYFDESVAPVEEEKKQRLEKQAFHLEQCYLDDLLFILTNLKLKYIIAPKGFEAEQVAAQLTQAEIADYVMSNDFDVLVFGGKNMLKKIPKKEGEFELYTLENTYKKINGERDKLVKIAIALGNDFNQRIKGCGPLTVIKKIEKIDFAEYKNSYDMFTKELEDIELLSYKDDEYQNVDYELLADWLKENSFADSRIKNWVESMKA